MKMDFNALCELSDATVIPYAIACDERRITKAALERVARANTGAFEVARMSSDPVGVYKAIWAMLDNLPTLKPVGWYKNR